MADHHNLIYFIVKLASMFLFFIVELGGQNHTFNLRCESFGQDYMDVKMQRKKAGVSYKRILKLIYSL